MSIVWSPEALADVEAALDYLLERSPQAAAKLATGIVTLIERIAAEPLEGPEHTLSDGQRVNGWPYPPFRIYYRRTSEGLLVVRVYHQRREPIVR